ncbi:MAG: HD-GYP domain-containing protein [Acidimicrobiales bacterium]
MLPWLMTWMLPAVGQVALAVWLSRLGIVGSPELLFWLVLVAASLCVLTSVAVLVRAFRRSEAELGYLGIFFLAVSLLPLVHGITTPGVIYGANDATMSAAQWSVPVALLVASPLLFPAGYQTDLGHRIWKQWIVAAIFGLVILFGSLLIWTELLPVAEPGSFAAMFLGLVCMTGCVVLSRRHLYLAQVANSPAPLVMAAGFGFVGASVLMWFGAAAFSIGFWVAHALDIVGVFGGTIGALVVLRSSAKVRASIEPILTTEPLAALELGLDPIVHRFVADLEAYDQVTRDHVVRTAELAVEVGRELSLSGRELRQLGLAALLHDVGKLELPPEIIKKPGRLTDAEFDLIKTHPLAGQTLVRTSPALSDIGPFIRGHHERIDGQGYPDGLSGPYIPLLSRIVAVCDAFDAMSNSRQYRDGMGTDKALAILHEHAGTQWDAMVVAAAERVIARGDGGAASTLDAVGRGIDAPELLGCDCLPTAALASSSSAD